MAAELGDHVRHARAVVAHDGVGIAGQRAAHRHGAAEAERRAGRPGRSPRGSWRRWASVARQSVTALSPSSCMTSSTDLVEAGLVVVGGMSGCEAPEEVGRADGESEPGEPVGHRGDVGTDPEDLLDEDDAGAVGRVGYHHVDAEGPVVDRHLVTSRGHRRDRTGSAARRLLSRNAKRPSPARRDSAEPLVVAGGGPAPDRDDSLRGGSLASPSLDRARSHQGRSTQYSRAVSARHGPHGPCRCSAPKPVDGSGRRSSTSGATFAFRRKIERLAAAEACLALSFTVSRTRSAHTYSVASTARPASISGMLNGPGSGMSAMPRRMSATPTTKITIRFVERKMNWRISRGECQLGSGMGKGRGQRPRNSGGRCSMKLASPSWKSLVPNSSIVCSSTWWEWLSKSWV